MKHTAIFAVIALFIAATPLAAEETLFSGNITNGGFGGPRIKYSSVGNSQGVFVGGRGGWIINHQFVIGGGGYGLATTIDAPSEAYDLPRFKDANIIDGLELAFGYGGLELEYIHAWERLIHLSVSALIGGGGVDYTEDNSEDTSQDTNGTGDSLFVFEPSVHAEINVTKWMRLNAGVSYLLVKGVDLAGLSDSDLSGGGISMILKFGSF